MIAPVSQKTKNLWCNKKQLPLTLLVLRIGADNTHHATAMNHLALVANFLDACPDFHTVLLLFEELSVFSHKS
jgi:hypothetical protein